IKLGGSGISETFSAYEATVKKEAPPATNIPLLRSLTAARLYAACQHSAFSRRCKSRLLTALNRKSKIGNQQFLYAPEDSQGGFTGGGPGHALPAGDEGVAEGDAAAR